MKCDNCKSSRKNYLFKSLDYITLSKFKIYECEKCKILYIHPRPKKIDKYYPKNYRSYIPIIKYILQKKSSFFVKSILKKYFYSSKNHFAKKILEIGCGNGEMLNEFLKLVWKVQGIERKKSIN